MDPLWKWIHIHPFHLAVISQHPCPVHISKCGVEPWAHAYTRNPRDVIHFLTGLGELRLADPSFPDPGGSEIRLADLGLRLAYLYIDTLRQHIASFVHIYNTHAIRKQVSREFYLPSGQPNVLYNYPSDGVRNYSTPPDQSLLSLIQDQLSWFDETAYLATTTRVLCNNIISQSNITYDLTKILPGTKQPHTQAYIVLRKQGKGVGLGVLRL
jgi:hypothetical protein